MHVLTCYAPKDHELIIYYNKYSDDQEQSMTGVERSLYVKDTTLQTLPRITCCTRVNSEA